MKTKARHNGRAFFYAFWKIIRNISINDIRAGFRIFTGCHGFKIR